MEDDFDYGIEEQPKKKGIFGIFTKKDKDVSMDTRSRRMPQPQGQPISDDLAKLLGGAYKGPDDQNMAMDYVGNAYVPISESYKPISETFQKTSYAPKPWEDFQYESPKYESASGVLFGEQGKAWENSPVFKKTGVAVLEPTSEKSSLYTPTGMNDVLFGNKDQTPMMNPVTGRPMDFPMKAPAPETLPIQRVTPVTQFSPSPVNIPKEMVQVGDAPVATVPTVPATPTLPTQIIPPQYIPQGAQIVYKRPVGRPRLNKPPKPKRPVGRPRKNPIAVETQMAEIQ